MNKKWLVVIILAAVIVLLVKIWPNLSNSVQGLSSTTNTISGNNAVTVNGWILCVPRKNSSTECVSGVQDKSGKNYALVDTSGQPISTSKFTTGSYVNIAGNLTTNDNLIKNYNIQGVIQINQ
jgi:hypothetical protein